MQFWLLFERLGDQYFALVTLNFCYTWGFFSKIVVKYCLNRILAWFSGLWCLHFRILGCLWQGGGHKDSKYVQYVPVVYANVPWTYYVHRHIWPYGTCSGSWPEVRACTYCMYLDIGLDLSQCTYQCTSRHCTYFESLCLPPLIEVFWDFKYALM